MESKPAHISAIYTIQHLLTGQTPIYISGYVHCDFTILLVWIIRFIWHDQSQHLYQRFAKITCNVHCFGIAKTFVKTFIVTTVAGTIRLVLLRDNLGDLEQRLQLTPVHFVLRFELVFSNSIVFMNNSHSFM